MRTYEDHDAYLCLSAKTVVRGDDDADDGATVANASASVCHCEENPELKFDVELRNWYSKMESPEMQRGMTTQDETKACADSRTKVRKEKKLRYVEWMQEMAEIRATRNEVGH